MSGCDDGVCFEPLNPELVIVQVKEEYDFDEEQAIKKEISSADEEASNTDQQGVNLISRRFDGQECVKEEEIFVKSEFDNCAGSDNSALVDSKDGDGVCFEPLNPELVIVNVKEEHDFEEETAVKNELYSADEEEASNTDRQDAGLTIDGEECVKEEEIIAKSAFSSRAGSDNSALVDNKDGEKPYQCKLCNYKAAVPRNLSRHMKTHSVEKPYACDWCSFRTAELSRINAHRLTHTGEKPYPCKLCNYKAVHPRNLARHMKTHTGEKPYACDQCSFRTADLTSINAHKLTHTGEKPYPCNLCNYKATQPGNLSRHMRTHTGEKPYVCDRCTFRAADVTSINIHKLTHTGEKPYSCKLCNYKAVNPGNLSRHMRTHTGEKPYQCNVCNYKAAQPGHLSRHMRTHTGEKPFKCLLCEYSCKRKRCLTKHMIQTHPEAPPLPFRMSQRLKTSDSTGSSNSSGNSKGQHPADAESISSDSELEDEQYCTIDVDPDTNNDC